MKTNFPTLIAAAILFTPSLACPPACAADAAVKARNRPPTLRESLLLHASFDRGLDADFAVGDKTLYTAPTGDRKQARPGLPDDNLVRLAKGEGKFGDALHFTKKMKPVVFFKGDKNIAFRTNAWSGACSLWLRLDPDKDLEPGYCDPMQFVGQAWGQGAFFVEFSQHPPREFRLGILPITKLWNPDNRKYEEMPTPERPVVIVPKPPFGREQWTHVVFTFGNANTGTKHGWGKLWLNGVEQGELKGWELTFGWEADQTAVTLGLSYIGWLDDLAVFNRPLTDAEVKTIFKTKGGVSKLSK